MIAKPDERAPEIPWMRIKPVCRGAVRPQNAFMGGRAGQDRCDRRETEAKSAIGPANEMDAETDSNTRKARVAQRE
jgi:hypothetical protein